MVDQSTGLVGKRSGAEPRVHIVYASYTWWPPHFGGELLVTKERLESLAALGHCVTVLTSGVPGYPRVESLGVRQIVYRSPSVGGRRWQRALRRLLYPAWLLATLWQRQFDVLHMGPLPLPLLLGNSFLARLAASLAHGRGARLVAVLSLADSEERPLVMRGVRGVYNRALFGSADVAVAVSPALHEALAQQFAGTTTLMMNAVRTDVFRPLPKETRQVVRQARGVSPDEVVFAFLGTVGYRKGFDTLATAFEQLCRDGMPARLWVIGPNSPAHNQNLDPVEVTSMLAPLADLDDRVTLWGRVDDRRRLREILGSADAFVFPSRREGQGLAPLEAMALEVPVIVSLLPGITDQAVVEGVSGLYITPGDVDGLTRAMRCLAKDGELRRVMGVAGRRVILNKFGWEDHIEEWERVYAGAWLQVGSG